ncbi:protein FAM205A [Perognathus longimembris pacificus]|uniref:protein FAM205A n=1 Tax=Perognathus longimembris pacificus TaxID=214514 RepID=UPI002019B0B7|nr:protein FAM205A [Perognathus longimembris pacificus]
MANEKALLWSEACTYKELLLAKRLIQEGETPWELLFVMKRRQKSSIVNSCYVFLPSQGWLPQEKSVRQLLCTDPKCKICNTVAQEIQELLEVDTNQFSTTSVSFEQKLKLHPQHSRETALQSVTPRVTEPFAESTGVVEIRECWADHLQLGQDIQLPEVSLGSETVASSRLEETAIIVNEQETQVTPNDVQGTQDHSSLNLQVPFSCQNLEITCLTHPMAMQIVPRIHLPFVKADILRLLELHVKKWVHFQRWGLPRRVEQSLRQLMPSPPMCYQPETNQPVPFILSNTPQTCIRGFGTICHETWCPYVAGQHLQIFWVSEWSTTDPVQRHHYQHIQNPKAITLPSPTVKVLEGLCPLFGEQTNSSRSNLQQKHYQLFCGLPSLHSESLVATLLDPQSLSKNMSSPFVKDHHLFKEFSYLPLLSQPCLESPQPSSPPCPTEESPSQHQETPIIPFLTQAECEALEWHLLQRQLQLQWGLPAAFQRPQHAQSPMQCEMCNKAQSLKIQKTLRSEKLSILTRELFFFPEHSRRLLGFHLQKHLIHLRWGLPEKIQKSIQLLLSSTGQQPLSWSSRALPNVSTSQPGAPEAKGDGCVFSPMMSKVSVPMPHLFVQAQAMLQSHIDSKCGQIHQGKVPVLVHSSWECRIPEVLAMAPFPDMLQGQLLELKASDPNLHHKMMPCEPMALGQQPQALLGSVIEHHMLPQASSEETIEKLETTLRHKYLAFLSGLPALYYVALSRVTSPVPTSQPVTTEMVPEPIKIPQEPLAQMLSLEALVKRPESGFQDDNKPCEVTVEKSQAEVQVEAETEMAPPKGQTFPASPCLLNARILAKLNFHMKKKVLEIQLGIPEGARKSKEPHAAVPENISTQEGNQSKQHQGNTALQELSTPLHSPPTPASEWLHPKEKQASEPQAMQHNQKHPGLKAVPHDLAPWSSEIPQLGGDMPEAPVLCVQVQTNVSNPSLEKPRSPEPQSPGKSKDSAHVSMLARKREDPGKLEAAGDFEGRDAGFGLSSAMEEVQPLKFHGKVQRPEGILLNKTPQGSWRWKYGFHPVNPCKHSPQSHPQPKFPESIPRRRDSEHKTLSMPHRQTKPNGILSPERIPNNAQPVVAQAPQGQPFLDQTTQDQPLQSPACKGRVLKGPKMPAHILKEARLADTGLRGKIKSFLYRMSPEMTGKGHLESTSCTAGKEAKPRTQNVLSSLAHTPSPTKRIKTEKAMAHPKVQSAPTEKSVGAASLSGSPSPGNKLRLRSRPQGSASVQGHPPMPSASATKQGNVP